MPSNIKTDLPVELINGRLMQLDFAPIERDLLFYLNCNIDVLVVTDASGSFTDGAGFSLNTFLKAFETPAPYVNIRVTTAHRGSGASAANAELQNFNFDQHDLSKYEVIMLFGVSRSNNKLTESELKAISEFMEAGGGMFATGDHEDLGVGMCGRIPRVRSMRRWYYNTSGPFGEPKAPPQSTTDGIPNHYTITDDPLIPGITLNQSDRHPQNMRPRYRVRNSNWQGLVVIPHPVLCGKRGVIKVMPDHMHEGLCELPYETDRSMTFSGHTIEEYPKDRNGNQVLPEVIATGTNQVDNEQFGLISVYDGHKAEQGRVLTDATWHHFFHTNLRGFESAVDRVNNGTGDAGDHIAKDKYADIQDYFRNIVYWLAPEKTQRCLRNRGKLLVTYYYDALITFQQPRYADIKYYFELGVVARDALNQLASRCQTRLWIDWIIPEIWRPIFDVDWKVNPINPIPMVDLGRLENIMLGSAIHAVNVTFPNKERFTEKDEKKLEAVLREGALVGLRTYAEELDRSNKNVMELIQEMDC